MVTARRLQRTIARETEVRGVGYIQGRDVSIRFRPAEADAGVVFVRSDLPGQPSVPAKIQHVIPRQRRTTIQQGEAVVEMVEHVMAALSGLHIDNCRVEIDGPETPGCDGSSKAFVEALNEAGVVELDRERETLVIDKPITVRSGQSTLTAYPGDGLVLSYQLDYGAHTPIGSQSLFVDISPESFRKELASSRTFLLENEAKSLRQAGIGTRTTESDLLIFGPDGVIGNTLRYPDECVRHKILDMVGDLALLAKDLSGHVVAHRSGHQLNAELVRKLIESAEEERRPSGPLDILSIMKILPHRYPFLLVDRVLELEPGRRVLAVKNVSCNEPFFQGHWPGRPIMPGVLIVEAMAQAAGILIANQVNPERRSALIISIDDVKIRKSVVPGDQLRLDITCLRLKSSSANVQGVAMVDDQVAAEAKIRFMIVEAERAA
ncbi:UDP-3-O-acyl-N-acetylglucosamine deacetylase [Singulisphaera sp. PoT]|uniref:UDP-3-O-acyl-N-acetylglucosamine deacetylase n=1 Tax=Singulisphaera sp. PoT TaxID=3411797 RepID=UPI003BF56C66